MIQIAKATSQWSRERFLERLAFVEDQIKRWKGVDGYIDTLRMGAFALRLAADHAQGAANPSEWQPIKTAPKDRCIMLCVKGFAPAVGRWWPVTGCWSSFDWGGHFEDDDAASKYFATTRYEPTHWMPPPAGPMLTSPEPHTPHDPTRCEICDWPLAESREFGCVPGDCSYRPDLPAEQERIRKRRAALTDRGQP
jgi:hypothetical protein